MAIDPMTLQLLTAGAGSLVKGASNLFPSKFERQQRERMEELKRREEMGALGLTEQERNTLEGRLQGRSQAAGERADAERQRLLAGQGAFAGQALQQATLADEGRAAQEVQIQQAIEEQNLQERIREEEELRALEAAQADQKRRRLATVAGAGSAMIEGGIEGAAQQRYMQGSKEPSEMILSRLEQKYGIDRQTSRMLLEAGALTGGNIEDVLFLMEATRI